MSSPTGNTSESHLHRLTIDLTLLRRIWRLCQPYWQRRSAWPSWLAIAALMGLIILSVSSGVWLSYVARDVTNALVERQQNAFWLILGQQLALSLLLAGLTIPIQYIGNRLQLHWRTWATEYFTHRYLQHRAYYELNSSDYIDNPDQRIQEEINPFCETIIGIPRNIIMALSNMGAQAGILLSVSDSLFYLTIALSVVQVYITYRLAVPTVKQNFDVTNTEANFRFGLVHLREHAENIAFYKGEDREFGSLTRRLRAVVDKTLIRINYAVRVMGFDLATAVGWQFLPYLLVAPLYFAQQIDFGAIGQAQAASAQIVMSFAVIANFIPLLANLAPHAVRLSELEESFRDLRQDDPEGRTTIELTYADEGRITLSALSLQTPAGERQLVDHLSYTLEPGQRLLIAGQTGVGKSSLLRAMGGLWYRGCGRIVMPSPERMLFLPQKPYMLLGSLREQLMYPRAERPFSDEELQVVLERVDLPQLAETNGGFDAVKDWAKTLSLGEQQRLAIARVLTHSPDFVFLDEATSAVDSTTELRLYGLLRRSRVTLVSVGHRPSLISQHTEVLRLLPEGRWRIETPDEAAAHEEAVNGGPDAAFQQSIEQATVTI